MLAKKLQAHVQNGLTQCWNSSGLFSLEEFGSMSEVMSRKYSFACKQNCVKESEIPEEIAH